jgi:exodeoxyribonuclease III
MNSKINSNSNFFKITKKKILNEMKEGILNNKSLIDSYKYDHLPEIPNNFKLKIYGWNVNGFRAIMKKGNFQEFIEKEDPDIICIGETKIDEDTLIKLNLHNSFSSKYSSFWNCCKVKKGYSGVAIFSKFKPINIFHGLNIEDHDREGRSITLEFESFFIVAVYVPNSGDGCKRLKYRVEEWDKDFQNYLHELNTKKDVIICGDMNVAHNPIDLAHPKANEGSSCYTIEERNSLTNLFNRGFIDTFRHLYPQLVKYSYFSSRLKTNLKKNVGWRLDYNIISSRAFYRLINSEILNNYAGSDHCPIKLSWKV